MSRTSRIPHPPGSRYVAIHVWAVERFGLAGAAIIGLLEFFDRAQPEPRLPLASRARILADLEGITGRDAIDNALKALLDATVIEKNTITEPGLRNLERRVQYSLNPSGFARLFGAPEIRSPRNSGFQEPPVPLKSGLKSGVPSNKELEVEAAAPRACARGTDSAAAPISESKRRHPRRTQNGIECWYPCEDAPADDIEATTPQAQISVAVAAIRACPNSANKPTSPVPALVKTELARQHRERLAVEQQAATAQRIAAADTLSIDPAAQAKGAQILAGIRRKSTSTSEATP